MAGTGAAGAGSTSPAARPVPRTLARRRAGARSPSQWPSRSLGLERRPQQRREFFLHFDQGLGALGALPPPAGLPFQFGNPLIAGIGDPWRRAARPWRPSQLAPIPGRPPRGQVGGVQALSAQQRTDGARRLTAVRFAQDLPLV